MNLICSFLILLLTVYTFAANLEVKYSINQNSFYEIIENPELNIEFIEKRLIYFAHLDSWELFENHGLIFRIRTKNGKIESSVKLRGLSEDEFTQYSKIKFSNDNLKYKCEIDMVLGGQLKRSCSLSSYFKKSKIKSAYKFIVKEQVKFVQSRLQMDLKETKELLKQLKVSGPIHSENFIWLTEDGIELSLESWELDDKLFFEISAKDNENSNIINYFSSIIENYNLISGQETTKTEWAKILFTLYQPSYLKN